MFIVNVALILVLLSGSHAVLPDVGKCTFMEYYCSALKCNTAFFKGLQKDPNGDCSSKYNQMANCTIKTLKICTGDQLSHKQIEGIVRQSFKEVALCSDGAIEVPTLPSVGSPCSASFSTEANACVKTFHEKFAADKSDPSLCEEEAKAKQCLKKLMATDCNFSSDVQEILDLSFTDYNPFCANNRDPGATGNDQCYGTKEPSEVVANGVATGHKSSVLQALLFSFVSLLFFVKV
ncbi:hypothetical protein OS493_035220 [Desmophyllum pertusum]|uniref:Uncharacterized protein n=1 Tax=Desmophyllum pertusum TaxID=174260 RepID=A0A9W9ZWN3_9CNID|nr:hypothetical protein OS493_035220 [Desmophyllum pertusum]